jgi:hypothetical protein
VAAAQENKFDPLFAKSARGVRSRLALRHALSGAAFGLVVALAASAVAWRIGRADFRRDAPWIGGAGMLVGLAASRRKRWSDTDVALYLDERLSSDEVITTAVDMRDSGDDWSNDAARAVVLNAAQDALTQKNASRARPRIFEPIHALLPLAAAGLVFVIRAPMPAHPILAANPGASTIKIADIDGLKRVADLAKMDARDEAQRERLDKISKDAEKLKDDLAKGMEKRDAQDRIAHLQDELTEERMSLGAGEKRAGLESAVSKLQEADATKEAAKALGDHDLESLDKEMERLANAREKADRQLAQEKLEQAADEARKNGAEDVGKALDDQKKSLGERAARADALRDLADSMKGTDDDVQNKSEALDRAQNDKSAKALADAMSKALAGMTPEERKRLADKLREEAKKQGVSQPDADTMKNYADDLSTPEGQKKLEDELKNLAKEDDQSDEAKRQKQLDDAQQGSDDAQGEIGKQKPQGDQGQQGQQGQGQQQQGQGQQGQQGQEGQQGQQSQGQQGQGQQGQGQQQGQGAQQGTGGAQMPIPGGGQGPQQGGAGGSHDFGSGSHVGSTAAVDAQTLKSRAHGAINKGQAMPGSVTMYTQGKAGGTANTRGSGDLRVVGPSEVDGVERSDVPEEYRENVRQYFQP